MTLEESMTAYYENYKPREVKDQEERKRREKIVLAAFILAIALVAGYLYTK
jgi:hypothetical protein